MIDNSDYFDTQMIKNIANTMAEYAEHYNGVDGKRYMDGYVLQISENVNIVTSIFYNRDVTEEELVNLGCPNPAEVMEAIRNAIDTGELA